MARALSIARLAAALLTATLAAAPGSSAETTGAIGRAAQEHAVAATPAATRSALPAVVSAARLSGDARRTVLTFDLTREVEMRAFALADPYRVIVDLDEAHFHIPPQLGADRHGLVRTFRYGLFAPGKSRIVIDLAAPALIERALAVEGHDGAPPRLHIELVRTDAAGFRRAMSERALSNLARRGDRESAARVSPGQDLDDRPPLVVIDPGHGGVDPGAIAPSTGDEEKAIVLDFAKVLRDKLTATGRYRVLMTRDRDIFVPLAERVKIARNARAQLFISIHADSIRGAADSARGVTVYTLSDRASDADSESLAERENKADAIAGLDLSEEPSEIADILIDLTRRETRLYSANFARTLAGEMRRVTRMHRLPLRSAGFQVLRAHDIPSVLVELGFVTSRRDLEMLTSAIWRDRTADSVTKAVDHFFAGRAGTVRPAAQR